MSEPNLAYEVAVEALMFLRERGLREVHSPVIFKAYESGVPTIAKLGGPPTEARNPRYLWFKDVRVWER